MNKANENARSRNENYQPSLVGDSYQPIPEEGVQNLPKVFIPPSGGTGARTIQIKAIETDKEQ